MTAGERILRTLAVFHDGLCDDCLSERSAVRPRQQVNQRATMLYGTGEIARERRQCPICGRVKFVSSLKEHAAVAGQGAETVLTKRSGPRRGEGGLQTAAVAHFAPRNSMPQVVSGRVDALIQDFDRCVGQFYSADKFPNSSYHFHARTVGLIRTRPYSALLSDDVFLEMVYATLATWGLDRMGVGKRLNGFDAFKATIQKKENVDILVDLSGTKLQELSDEESGPVEERLGALYDGLADVMLTSSKLVGVSKTMHHLLPDLVPPMDRAYTLNFFYQRRYLATPPIQGNEKAKFIQMIGQFRAIARKRHLTKTSLTRRWDTSVPKLVDNAIIGFVDLNMR